MTSFDCTRATLPHKPFFSALTNEFQDDPRLKPRDLQVFAALLRFARQKNWASVGNKSLASLCRCTPRTIQSSLARLEAAGWVRRVATVDAPGSASGRLVYLRPREIGDAPPVKSPSTTPVKSAAPESEEQGIKREAASAALDGPTPTGQMKDGPPPPHEPLDYAALGWLDRPESDPLRQIAERALAARLAGPASVLEPPRPKTPSRASWRPSMALPARAPIVGDPRSTPLLHFEVGKIGRPPA
jgi:DNA-binding MarR family transcriptional regulator